MLNRKRLVLQLAIQDGKISRPQLTYSIDEKRNSAMYLWHESNIMEAHAYLLTVHRGRPRRDGKITPQKMPTARELRAMIRQETILHVMNDDGEFVPVWKAPDFD